MKIILVGTGEMLANLIQGCMLAGVEIVGVFRYERLLYSSLRLFFHDFFSNSPDLTLIRKFNLRDINCKSVNSEKFRNEILKTNTDIVLVGTWREKFKKETIDMPVIGTINVHPALLPKYRGPNPYLQTIWHREKESGVTFHLMDEKFDSGAVLAQAKVEILDGDTSKELKNKTVFKARLLCTELLEKLKTGAVVPVSQEESAASYYPNIKPEDMTLNFEKETAEDILAHVRAFYPFVPTYIQYNSKTFYITNPYKISLTDKTGHAGQIVENDLKHKMLTIACEDGKCVKFENLKKYK